MDSNIYEFNAARVLGEYTDFLDGVPNCSLVAVSSLPVSDIPIGAKDAIMKSAERLGYGLDSVAWVGLSGNPGAGVPSIASKDLLDIVEGMDPIAVICLDAESAEMFACAYGLSGTAVRTDAVSVVLGRCVVAFRDFAGMLADPEAKQRAWAMLKELTR